MLNPPNIIVAELMKRGLSLEDAEEMLAQSIANPGTASSLAKTVVEAWNGGESTVPIYIALQLAMAVLEQQPPKDTGG